MFSLRYFRTLQPSSAPTASSRNNHLVIPEETSSVLLVAPLHRGVAFRLRRCTLIVFELELCVFVCICLIMFTLGLNIRFTSPDLYFFLLLYQKVIFKRFKLNKKNTHVHVFSVQPRIALHLSFLNVSIYKTICEHSLHNKGGSDES